MITNDELLRIMERISDTTATEAEIARFNAWCDSFKGTEPELSNIEDIKERVLARVHGHMDKKPKASVLYIRRIAVAAAAVAAIVLGVWLNISGPIENHRSEVVRQDDIKPGKNRATLTLSNGKAIQLSDTKSGIVIDASSLKYNDGTNVNNPALSRSDSSPQRDESVGSLTVTTPRGGTYQVRLPDGTNVWLNAASSLTYMPPLKERGGVRMVSLSGEAYFEVFKNKDQPFVVRSKNQEIKVLGTHFNVSAYENDGNTITSLLEGSVRVNTGDGVSSILKPGQQSVLTGSAIKIKEVDPQYSVAWKNGYFMFASESIGSIMKKISRWYDVEIDYQGKITAEGFTGSVSKYEQVSEVLKTLELTGLVHFKIEGRRITVMP